MNFDKLVVIPSVAIFASACATTVRHDSDGGGQPVADANTTHAGDSAATHVDAMVDTSATNDAPVPAEASVIRDAPPEADVPHATPPDAATTPPDASSSIPDAGSPVPTIGGCTMFPADNWWNQDISSAPVDPNSDAIIANINSHASDSTGTFLHADFGSDPSYGMPYAVVPATQADVPVTFVEYPTESDPGPYPVPGTTAVQAGGDHHVLVVQQGTCMLYEMYHAQVSGPGWQAGSGAVFDLTSDALRPNGWTSCDEAGLPILPGLTRYDEVSAGEIHHALRVTLAAPGNTWVTPARHPSTNTETHAPPMGTRIRLRANFDLSNYTGNALVILTALKRYGLMVADTGGNWFISGETNTRWSDTDLNQLKTVPGSAFEVTQLGSIQHW